jgi:replicative DNA helicase
MASDSPAGVAENPVQTNGNGGQKTRARRGNSSQKTGAYLPDIHRSLPQSIDAEKGLIGSILLDPGRVLDDCIKDRVSEKHFHHPAHAKVYTAMLEMARRGDAIDLILLTQRLEDLGELESVGGAAALADLFTFVPTATNASYYREILREKFLLREVIAACTRNAARAYDEQSEVHGLLEDVEREVLAIRDDQFTTEAMTMKDLAMGALDDIERLIATKGALTGLSTGFSNLDRMTNGLHEGEMFVIAARPSMGKTALAMNIAEHVALEGGKAVGVFSLEMSTKELMKRLLCSVARVDLRKLQSGFPDKGSFSSLLAATNRLSRAEMFIDDTPALSIMDLSARARRLHQRNGIQLVVIDYLQLLRSNSRRAQDNRQIEVAEISAGIKALAKELKIPIIVLAQLNRNPESRTGSGKGRPRLSDLRESGSIEQDADVVGLLWREKYYAEDDEEKKDAEGKAELIIAKQRNGPTGEAALTFLEQFTRFEDRAEDREEPR